MKKYILVIALCFLWIVPVHAGGYKLKYATGGQVVTWCHWVDKTDGNTLETGLATAIDNATTGIMLSKNGGANAVRSATVTTSTYANGCYYVTLSATDTNTLGNLTMSYSDNNTTALPMTKDLEVVPLSIYYAFFGAATPTLISEASNILTVTESVSSAGQWNNGHRFKAWAATTGNLVASSCITGSTTGASDTITTREDISGLTDPGNLISIEADGGCQALRPTTAERTLDVNTGGSHPLTQTSPASP